MANNIFTIGAGNNFLDVVVQQIFAGRLTSLVMPADFAPLPQTGKESLEQTIITYWQTNPLALADLTIYVPTRRLARQLRDCFLKWSSTKMVFLPNIVALADIDLDAILFSGAYEEVSALGHPIDSVEQLLLVTKLVMKWYEKLPDLLNDSFTGQLRASPRELEAVWLARNFIELFELLESWQIDWSVIENFDFGVESEWWRVSWDFLQIIRVHLPEILQSRSLLSKAKWQQLVLKLEAKRALESNKPVLALGFATVNPAEATFLQHISNYKRGGIVLPFIDECLDNSIWQSLEQSGSEVAISAYNHPQKDLAVLLNKLGCAREDLISLAPIRFKERQQLLSHLFCLPEESGNWSKLDKANLLASLADFTLIEAKDEREESLALAIAIRKSLSDPDKKIALICPDVDLKRRVCGHLRRFNILPDDAHIGNLLNSKHGVLLTLLLELVFKPSTTRTLVSFLQNSLIRAKYSRAEYLANYHQFEMHILRKTQGKCSLFAARKIVKEQLVAAEASETEAALHAELSQLALFLDRLIMAIKPLTDLSKSNVSLKTLIAETVKALEKLAVDELGDFSPLYSGEAGEALLEFLKNILVGREDLTAPAEQWPDIMAAFLVDINVTPESGVHPRLFLWDVNDAWLQTVDSVVIAGLNEECWPKAIDAGPFFSSSMKRALGLPATEQVVGESARILQQLLYSKEVILSRAVRSNNNITLASRWWLRLQTILGETLFASLLAKGQICLAWGKELEARYLKQLDLEGGKFINRPYELTAPAPRPPVELRPKNFSISDIKALANNPYEFYAKKILKLRKLPAILEEVGARDKGNLWHNILDDFCKQGKTDDKIFLQNLVKESFTNYNLAPNLVFLWQYKLPALVDSLIKFYEELGFKFIESEVSSSKISLNSSGICLYGRIDLIAIKPDNTVILVDFKTGSARTLSSLQTLKEPQLLLEALLCNKGAINLPNLPGGKLEVTDVKYVYLRDSGELEILSPLGKDGKATLASLVDSIEEDLLALLQEYEASDTAYLYKVDNKYDELKNDYSHLARVAQASLIGGV